MPPIERLQYGVVTTIAQNRSYALPQQLCHISTSLAIEASFDGTTWTADPGGPGPASHVLSAPYIRCTTGNALVIIKRA